MRRLWLTLTLLAVVGAGPCNQDKTVPASPGLLEGEGTIHQGVAPECPSIWAIRTSDGRTLWPVNDPAFQVEGLRVRYSARERTDVASACMAGTTVDVLSIRKL